MNFLLWKITIEPYRFAKIQWLLFKLFGRKPKNPCGHTKSTRGYYCHQPLNLRYCEVINEGTTHEIVCKCCGHTRITSSEFINPDNNEWWNI